ncbi:MAG: NifB/NifX family molybdenum-iron cluster-binding protein [Desulfocapsaceae bacterium]|jgi:predicted Fe-Mo cluster-binding NifX family protein|nr:NifB/NifX family molybdenum-iron cluster-binding protein [Desulfocapsaceae bacterium]
MKVAITVWGNRISPVFDSAQTLLLAEIRGKQIVDKKIEFMPLLVPVSIARKIVELGPDSLICGAISRQPAKIIEDAGITLVPFISGKAEPILRAYARNLEINRFCMPGCAAVCPRRNMKQAGSDS